MTKGELFGMLADLDDDQEIEIDFCYNEDGDVQTGQIVDVIEDYAGDRVVLDCCIG